MLRAVVCAQTAHINVDESSAPQWVGGFKLWVIATPDGKLSPELIAQEAYGFGFEHRAQPLAVSMTQSTELGTLMSWWQQFGRRLVNVQAAFEYNKTRKT